MFLYILYINACYNLSNKIYISYYAQIRNFPKNLIGLSTVKYPPKWRPLGQDKRGVWVIDCPILKPGKECEGLCNGQCEPKHPDDCNFLKVYFEQLMKLDFNDFMERLKFLRDKICTGENLSDVNFALLVFETPTNPCSERKPLHLWLKYNGIEVEEWHKANS